MKPYMEEHSNMVSLILHGCKLAKELESNLGDHQSNELANRCDEIAKIFGCAKERLRRVTTSQDYNMLTALQNNASIGHGGSFQELLRSCTTTTDHDIIRGFAHHENRIIPNNNMATNIEILGSSSSSSSSQRPRKRKDDPEIRIVKMAAPQIGNTEIPPEDNYTWRKYGQKEIMGSKYPRGYYRCTHQKLYNCSAKKQVQRLDDDPLMFEVMYRGNHTCHMSATAPTSVLPPQGGFVSMSQSMVIDHPSQPLTAITTATATATCSVPLGGSWLSMKCSAATAGGGRGGGSTSGGGGGGGSTNKEMVHVHDFHPVLDLADVMFNSGSSSSNSMEFLFPTSMEEDRK
ncbi:WRKY transcription factor 55 [Humulus lupulus]|uniref:WRKY transcription factor 55 n=1 Tax=Humulus lupulus TaxID=3486 RepID=UPI002B40EA52|nr:WRKY transcription factor 55 [Humulus lupulus]